MNIILMTNTYKPIMGGLEKSVEVFATGYRKQGHRVLIIAPEFENMVPEDDVIRIPAIQNFNGTDFSVQLPIPGMLAETLGDFRPDIVHAQHPFLVGDTALRMAYKYNVPLVYTHHTLYEQNTHYVPGDSEAMKRFVIQLSTGYGNLADMVFAPSESLMELIQSRGVESSVQVVPTGIDTLRFASGDPKKMRTKIGVSDGIFLVGHTGRFAPEKNLEFLAQAVLEFMKKNQDAHFMVVGKGPLEETIKKNFEEAGMSGRLHMTGPLSDQELVDAYQAMDVFVFASQSETQGLVLAEAMAAGVPVVAVDAIGVRDVVRDKLNGRLLPQEDKAAFVEALEWLKGLKPEDRKTVKSEALKTADHFSMDRCVQRGLDAYAKLITNKEFMRRQSEESSWAQTARMIQAQWDLAKNLTKATAEALLAAPAASENQT